MNNILLKGLLVAVVLLNCIFVQADTACEIDNVQLQSMPIIEVVLTRDDGSVHRMHAKLANTKVARAAGFQRVCESTIERMPIVFEFQREVVPHFHMNNVVAPIDIAFIDKTGRIVSIQAMAPYVLGALKKPLYSPNSPVIYALEVHEGFFQEHEVSLSSKFAWNNAE